MTTLYNEMQQPIIYRGQLCVGDKVYTSRAGISLKVLNIREDAGRILVLNIGSKHPIMFIEGKGWCYYK